MHNICVCGIIIFELFLSSEFYSKFHELLKQNKVFHNYTDANQKSGFVESGIAKLHSKLEKLCTLTGELGWTKHQIF